MSATSVAESSPSLKKVSHFEASSRWGRASSHSLGRKHLMRVKLFNSILEILGELLLSGWPGDLKDVSFLFLLQHLSISNGNIQVDASFMQTLWNVHPTCSGSSVEEGVLLSVCSALSLPVCLMLCILTFFVTFQFWHGCLSIHLVWFLVHLHSFLTC